MSYAFVINREVREVSGIQMYATTGEPDPISLAYPNTDEGREAMAQELAANGKSVFGTDAASVEDWRTVIASACPILDGETGEVRG